MVVSRQQITTNLAVSNIRYLSSHSARGPRSDLMVPSKHCYHRGPRSNFTSFLSSFLWSWSWQSLGFLDSQLNSSRLCLHLHIAFSVFVDLTASVSLARIHMIPPRATQIIQASESQPRFLETKR